MSTPQVVMYSTGVCPYCMCAEQLLRACGVTEIEKIRIDLDPARRDEMIARTSRRTVPQIFIGDTHSLDRKSVVQGKSVDLGGRRIIKKKN